MSAYRNSDDVVDNIVIDFFPVIYLIDMCMLSYKRKLKFNNFFNQQVFFLLASGEKNLKMYKNIQDNAGQIIVVVSNRNFEDSNANTIESMK